MQKGFIQLTLSGYIIAGLTVALLISAAMLKVQSSRLESCKAEFQTFKSEVERVGKEAEIKVKQIEAENKLKKEQADNELKKLRLDNAEFKRLRDSNPSERGLPKAPADSRNPALSCFDRTSLESAYGELVKELRGIADEGTEATIGLDTVKRWAQ